MSSYPCVSEIDGVWRMVRAELAGEAAPELIVKNSILELAHGEYHVHFRGETADKGTFELGGNSHLRTMLLRSMEGSNSGRTIPCIYQLAGNRLCVCFGIDGVVPMEFKTSAGQSLYLASYERKAEEPDQAAAGDHKQRNHAPPGHKFTPRSL